MHVLLDLYGVLLDSAKMTRAYRERLAEILSGRFGGDAEEWKRAHDEAYRTYLARVGSEDWDARAYGEIVDELDARFIVEIFQRAGIPTKIEAPLAVMRGIEREVFVSVDARFPDARTAVERLGKAGHRVYVVTGGSETNDAALIGAGLRPLVERLFTGHTQGVHKGSPGYWKGIPAALGAPPDRCVVVDDRLDYLEAAASVGIHAFLLDRKGTHEPEGVPSYVRATLRNLAGLPHLVQTLERDELP